MLKLCDSLKPVSHRYLRNEFDFWKVLGVMNISGLLQSK